MLTNNNSMVTPWQEVQRLFSAQIPDAAVLSKKYEVPEGEVLEVFSGKTLIFSDQFCTALRCCTGMPVTYFHNLCLRYQQATSGN